MISNYGAVAAMKPCCNAANQHSTVYHATSGKCDCDHKPREQVKIPRKYRGRPKFKLIKRG